MSHQDYNKNGYWADADAASAPVDYGTPLQPASSSGQAIGARVCGILSIVLCLVPLLGGVLGIVAIILAIVSRKDQSSRGMSIAGLITGIIGVLIGLLFTVLTIGLIASFTYDWNDVDSSYEQLMEELNDEWDDGFGDGAVSGTFDDEDDQAAYDSAVETLDIVCNPDDEAKQNLADAVNDSFKRVSGMDLEDIGVDPMEIVEWTVEDASYEITDVYTSSSGTGTVYYTSHVRDIDDLIDVFTDDVGDYIASPEFAIASDDQKKQRIGELMDEAMNAEFDMKSNSGWLDMQEFAGHWAPSQDSLDRLGNEFYGTMWG